MIVIHFAHFSAPYRGSFINSLKRLEDKGSGDYKFIYCFPRKAESSEWMEEFSKLHHVFFTIDNLKESTQEILGLYRNLKPDIVHTHFDGYDIPVSKARDLFLQETGKPIKVIWHLHNQIQYEKNYIKKVYQYLVFTNHYGKWAKKANIISVNEGMKAFVNKFSNRNKLNVITEVIQNGIDTYRFAIQENQIDKKEFVFGALSKQNIGLLFKAGLNLKNKGLDFKMIVIKGTGLDTEKVVEMVFNDKQPSWLKLIERTGKIEEFYKEISCFVSISTHETFSNAIAEATMLGIPVIQSDIPGTMWNAENPSTFLFESLNVENLTEVMEKVILYPKDKMKENCLITRQNNEEKYGDDIWCERVLNFYKKI